jgi:ORF6N domain
VETKVLVQAVKRNLERFPADFMFQLSSDEYAALRSQFVTSNVGRGGRRYTPYAFTEQGVAILSSVLSSARAIVINVEIMRAFVQVRAMAATHEDVANQLATSSGPWALALRQLEVAVCDLKFEGALGLRQFTILSIANY